MEVNNTYSQEEAIKIMKSVAERLKGKQIKCLICGYDKFDLLEGYTNRLILNKIDTLSFGKTIPSISLGCQNCGHILDFGLGAFKKEPDKPYLPINNVPLPIKPKEEPKKIITKRKGIGGMVESKIPHLPALNFKLWGFWKGYVIYR